MDRGGSIRLCKRIVLLSMLFAISTNLWNQVEVKADMGPKPSVVVRFTGLEDTTYYVTLLSETSEIGPHNALLSQNGHRRYVEGDELYEVSNKFIAYQDRDGFYYLQYLQKCYDNETFTWGYYPPDQFKILIYIPDRDLFIESNEIFERYAFDSYYHANVMIVDSHMEAAVSEMEVRRSYNLLVEFGRLCARSVLTIMIEFAIALFFFTLTRKDRKVILVTNLMTQCLLNLFANLILVKMGYFIYIIFYCLIEIVIIVVEAFIYQKYLSNRRHGLKCGSVRPVLYAIVANVTTAWLGVYLGIQAIE